MSIKVGINGFGRIGRMVFRASINHPEIEIVGINDLCPADYLAYMLKYDTMHGQFQGTVESTENSIIVNGHEIPISAERNPADLPWGRPVPDPGEGCRSPGCRRQEGCHVRPLQGRYPHVCLWRQPG